MNDNTIESIYASQRVNHSTLIGMHMSCTRVDITVLLSVTWYYSEYENLGYVLGYVIQYYLKCLSPKSNEMFVEQRQRRRSTLSLEVQKMSEGKPLTHFQVTIQNNHHHHFPSWQWRCWGKRWLPHSSSRLARASRRRWRTQRTGNACKADRSKTFQKLWSWKLGNWDKWITSD